MAENEKKPKLGKIINKIRRKGAKYLDGFILAGKGIALATKRPSFNLTAIVTSIVFGMILHFFSTGLNNWDLFWQVDSLEKIKLLGKMFTYFWGVSQAFLDWLVIFSIALLQGVLVGLLVLLRQEKKIFQAEELNDNIQNVGLVAGLALLGSGCPTCGTVFLAPLLGTIFSSGGYAIAGKMASWLTTISFLVALVSLRKLGMDTYAIMVSNRRKRKQENEH